LLFNLQALPPSTRIRFSLSVCAVAAAGIFLSDVLEKRMPIDSEKKGGTG
ncbi:hypothetical protein EV360DRAFT_45268, partial [Lentinula raphanica]